MSIALLQNSSAHLIHRILFQCCHNAVGSVSIVDSYGNEIDEGKVSFIIHIHSWRVQS
jgi:hypothetical protein